jgi:hypothetical protein
MLPQGADLVVSDALDWIFPRLAATGRLLADPKLLSAAGVGDCFPAGSADVVLGASGFDMLPSPPVSLASILGDAPQSTLDDWFRATGLSPATLASTQLVTAIPTPGISFVTPSISPDTLQANLLRSRTVQSGRNELLIERRGPHVQIALNSGVARARNDLVVVVHEDVYLPPLWEGMFRRGVRLVEARDPSWGVVGCAGVRRRFGLLRVRRRGLGHARDSGATWGGPFDQPEPVETLDEFLIAFRRRRNFHFDENQPNYHFYAVDLCLQATAAGFCSYAIEAFCCHNNRPRHARKEAPLPDFVAGCDYMRRKWRDRLPILTTCTIIARDPARDHHARRLRAARRGAP